MLGATGFGGGLPRGLIDVEAAVKVLHKIEGLNVNYLDSKLCCFIPPHFEQLVGSIRTRTLVTICTGCYSSLTNRLQEKGDYQIRMLPEIVLEAVRGQ